jgi:hypothetical protein
LKTNNPVCWSYFWVPAANSADCRKSKRLVATKFGIADGGVFSAWTEH